MTQRNKVPQHNGFQQTEIGAIPTDWNIQPLRSFTTAVASGRSDSGAGQGSFPVHGSTGVIGYTEFPEYSGDAILVARVGANAGKLSLVSGHYGITDNTIQIRIGKGAVLAFVYRLLEAKRLNQFVFGSGQPLITGSQLKSLPLAFPSFNEQQEIATALNDVDALLAGLDRLITKKRDLKQAAMQQLLTGQTRLPGYTGKWKVMSLGELFGFSGGYAASRDELSSEGHRYLHYGDIHGSSKTSVDTTLDAEDIPRLDVSLKQVSPDSLLHHGDVVFVDASEDDEGTTKHIVVSNHKGYPFIAGLHTIVAKPRTADLTHEYRHYCFQTEAVRKQFFFYAVGTKVSGISKTNIAKVFLPIPSTNEQVEIASMLADMESELATLQLRRDKTRALKQAVMQELLTGRIRLT